MTENVFDIEPQHPDYEGAGPEPSLRAMVRSYYRANFPRPEADTFTREYFRALAQAIETRRAATGTGAVADESAVPTGCAHTQPESH